MFLSSRVMCLVLRTLDILVPYVTEYLDEHLSLMISLRGVGQQEELYKLSRVRIKVSV